jgi:hypothetical protein
MLYSTKYWLPADFHPRGLIFEVCGGPEIPSGA